ncbi:MAG: hypothetical protein GWN01_11825 [Nitrosopumilaceae archaeon]|nr:hypothetical protein [Nitrosopumilaceae archaeon]NIU01564.1 hypothetical protein [Nitrosopumilaceae archaeon]NIU88545.1 hypothetical protein [Nitrosopumilaceae archaeon]NIV66250.1 hypothetical protein [Nitrosopumilaceae archaeon]NIX62166.1 hypothetical protein [Nitrosopumilaceae archaeon]
MNVLTATDTELFDKLCQKILELDSKIRFAGVISEMGKIISSSEKKGIKPILDKPELEMLFMEVALRVRMRHQFDRKLGVVDYTVSKRKRLVVMSFPYRNCILYATTEKDTNVDSITQKISELIRSPELIES